MEIITRDRSSELTDSAEALRQSLATPLPLVACTDYDHDVGTARAQLGEAIFAAAWAEGSTLSLERAIAHALDEGD